MFVCWNLYEQIVQTSSHTSQQKITRKKKGEWKEKKSTTWHLPISCMHPIKPVTLGLQRVKGGEKNKKWEMQKVKGGERYAESKGSGGGVNVTLGLENILFIIAFFF